MAVKNPLLQKAMGFTASVLTRWWRKTIDWRAAYFDPTVDPVHPNFRGRKVFACWHEYMLMPIFLRGHRSMLGLASEHGDGEIIARAMHHLGWGVARGSTTRNGITALLRLLKDDRRHISITPDGPQGPRRCMSMGTVFMASRLGIPIICSGYGYQRPWRMHSWDRFAVPRPFSRGRAVYGPALSVPGKLDRDGLELYRQWFERLLNWLTDQAELWADGKCDISNSVPVHVKQTPVAMHRDDCRSNLRMPVELAQSWTELPGQRSRSINQALFQRAA